eukprot:641901-Amphidinium_carterae.1
MYCMALPRMLLSAAGMDAVTQIRVSDDYGLAAATGLYSVHHRSAEIASPYRYQLLLNHLAANPFEFIQFVVLSVRWLLGSENPPNNPKTTSTLRIRGECFSQLTFHLRSL